jgi:hypothetical protein
MPDADAPMKSTVTRSSTAFGTDAAARPQAASLDPVAEQCRQVLDANWREGTRGGTPYGYTAPSPGRYPWQVYWDSCFTAIARRRLDPARARRELETLLAAADGDGFIGHTIFWAKPVDRVRSLFYNVRSRADFITRTIQPPMLAWAWSLVAGDPAQVPEIVRHQEYVERQRDLDGDGLIWLIQPDESGLDASPKFDSAWGWHRDGLPGFPLLVRRNRRLDFDIRRISAAGGPLVCGTATNVLHNLSRVALGRPSLTPTIVDACTTSGVASSSSSCARAPSEVLHPTRSSPGRRCHRSRCPTFPKRSAADSLKSTSSIRSASGSRSLRHPSRPRSHASRGAIGFCSCANTGAARPGSTRPGCCGSAWFA